MFPDENETNKGGAFSNQLRKVNNSDDLSTNASPFLYSRNSTRNKTNAEPLSRFS
ncbi:hypothetical protein BofuT4_uP110240.1 [Botrytis cinerea T4]|uniref:Uncharacterized protein n=1 Tax=Botryotinia fuckeliana (strain T4) TaxID=999810 RepID=G2Y7N8_BOTF4|nr:hypothetical protein BofuT4_uP110240.1 [Botrytis cinerea T4]